MDNFQQINSRDSFDLITSARTRRSGGVVIGQLLLCLVETITASIEGVGQEITE